MSLAPIMAKSIEELVTALNDRLRRISLPVTVESVPLPQKPDSPVPRSWVEANFVTRESLRSLLQTEIVKTNVQTTQSVRSHAIVFSISGTLAVEAAAAPLLVLDQEFPATKVRALLKRAPEGNSLIARIVADNEEWTTVTVADGETSAESSVTKSLPSGAILTVDIVQVGSAFPGAGLTVEVT
jgi:hypothetical protein